MNCKFCGVKLRSDNKIGTCRKHRSSSESRKDYIKKYTTQNKNIIKDYKKTWGKENRNRLNKQQSERLKTDISFRVSHSLRVRLNYALNKKRKVSSHIKELGCTVGELKVYLESKFKPGMTWENHGKWEIDHIYPLSKVDLTDIEQFKKVCHYTNLQPLWAKENRAKYNRIESSQECPTT